VRVRLIGYWREELDDRWPDPRDLVDETWDERERGLVAAYLEEGLRPWACAGYSHCRFCGKTNGCAEVTDGVYLWPEGLAHYVREHSVRLPDDVLEYIKQGRNELASLDEPARRARQTFAAWEVDREWWQRVGRSLAGEK
jgi:hypothetical protein